MAKQSVTFTVNVDHGMLGRYFNSVVDHWVRNSQSPTSPLARGLIQASAASDYAKGRAMTAGFTLGLTQAQGARYPDPYTAIVNIPASASTYGGEMTITAAPSKDGHVEINIVGRTYGFLGGTLRKNINEVQSYLSNNLLAIESTYPSPRESEVTDTNDVAGQIEHPHQLLKSGAISPDEYEAAKRKLLT